MITQAKLAIANANIKDAASITALINSAYRGDSSRLGWTTEADLLGGQRTDIEQIQELIEKAFSVILLCLDLSANQENLVGLVHLEKTLLGCYLGMLTVRPTLQGRGIGKFLLKQSETYVSQTWRCNSIFMTVFSRRPAIRWYVKRGYIVTGEKRPFNTCRDPRLGIPKVDNLEFDVLKKTW